MSDNLFISYMPNETYLSEISLLGTHDSCANNVEYESIARCQSESVNTQLQKGIRLFDIRLSYSMGRFPLVHSLADCYVYRDSQYKLYFEYVFSVIKSFLKKNPKETVVISVKKDRGILKNTFAKYFIKNFIENNKKYWFLENKIPKLSEVRGKIVLLRRFYCPKYLLNKLDGKSLGIDLSDWKNQNKKSPKGFFTVNINEKDKAIIQDCYNLKKEQKWADEIRPLLDITSEREHILYLNWLNTSRKDTPLINSEYINLKLSEYFKTNKHHTGWLLVDFPSDEIIKDVIEINLNGGT